MARSAPSKSKPAVPTAPPKAAKAAKAPRAPDAPAPRRRKAILSTAESPYYQLWVLSNLTARPFHKFGEQFHMNLTDWRIMLTVADRPGITAQALADYSGLDKMSVSRAVRSLEAQGRLQREGNVADRRSRHLALTEAGWAVYAEIAQSAIAREAHIHARLSADDLVALRRMLSLMSEQARMAPS